MTATTARDVYQRIHDLDAAAVRRLVDRMEARRRDPTFSGWRDAYLDRLDLAHAAVVLEVGCGSGTVTRAIAGRAITTPPAVPGRIIASDYSPALLTAGRDLARAEGVGGRIEWQVQDSHALTLPDGSADIAIAHTVVSHLADPRLALAELARVLRPGGTAVVFDGDYASLTFGGVDQVGADGEEMQAALVATIAANPTVLRTMPGLAAAAGLETIDATAHVLAEVGTGTFFVNFAETYAPMAADAGLVRREPAADWLDRQRRAHRAGTFFAACNYYTYLLNRPG